MQYRNIIKGILAPILAVAVFISFLPSPAYAAGIAFDATSHAVAITNALTFNHTITGANTILLCGVQSNEADTITGVTYNGVNMPQLKFYNFAGDSNNAVYGLINPTTGTNSVVVNSNSSSHFLEADCASYTGASQSQTLPDASNANSSLSATSVTTSVTTVANNTWIYAFGFGGGVVTAGTALTERTAGSVGFASFDTNASITPAGATTVGVAETPTNRLGLVAVSFAPVATPATIFNFGLFFGW